VGIVSLLMMATPMKPVSDNTSGDFVFFSTLSLSNEEIGHSLHYSSTAANLPYRPL
jgi:hypothetical protein